MAEKNVVLEFVNVDPFLPKVPVLNLQVQKINASLALAITQAFLKEKEPTDHRSLFSQDILRGIE